MAGLAWPALAQAPADLGALREQLAQMSQTVTELHLAQSTVAPGAAAQLELRLSALEEEIRRMTGKIEEAQNSAEQVDAKLKNLQEDTEFRLNRLEQATGVLAGGAPAAGAGAAGAGAAPAPSSPPPATTAAATPAAPPPATGGGNPGGPSPASSSPAALTAYDKALGSLRRGEYDQAEGELKSFIAAFGSDKLAGNAQYWLGETYYVRGNYDLAAKAFLDGIKTYPGSAKAPDSFLKLGMSLIQMNQKDKGCQVLAELPTRYADASQTIKSRADRERKAAGCP
ncbi:tol-pal system protein YbgF [Oleomonas cavernae]|uniref:Cell division coordinator CpoB n=2 Tax=Oleomonas cavernae TaxID=2320859 RepID=A0A418VUC8_9PROT|nr:tol-pal system protein YbgF [Oleomonas cavernae]